MYDSLHCSVQSQCSLVVQSLPGFDEHDLINRTSSVNLDSVNNIAITPKEMSVLAYRKK